MQERHLSQCYPGNEICCKGYVSQETLVSTQEPELEGLHPSKRRYTPPQGQRGGREWGVGSPAASADTFMPPIVALPLPPVQPPLQPPPQQPVQDASSSDEKDRQDTDSVAALREKNRCV